jgi:hypothetical protein
MPYHVGHLQSATTIARQAFTLQPLVPTYLPSEFKTRHDHRPKFDYSTPVTTGCSSSRSVTLHHEVDRKTQPAHLCAAHVGPAEGALHDLGVVRHHGDIVAAVHQPPHLPRSAVHVLAKDLHHVLLGVGSAGGVVLAATVVVVRGRVGAMTILRYVEGFVIVQEFEDVGGWGRVDDGRGNELVHGFVGVGVGGVVQVAGAAGGDGAGEEGDADGALLGDALQGADQVRPFEVLFLEVLGDKRNIKRVGSGGVEWGGGNNSGIPLIRGSIGLSARRGHRYRQTD